MKDTIPLTIHAVPKAEAFNLMSNKTSPQVRDFKNYYLSIKTCSEQIFTTCNSFAFNSSNQCHD